MDNLEYIRQLEQRILKLEQFFDSRLIPVLFDDDT